ncbi:MAG: hypothetical protein AAF611_13440 [Bacteroidota bacterium]
MKNGNLSDAYKTMMDEMLEKEKRGELDFMSEEEFRNSLLRDSESSSE